MEALTGTSQPEWSLIVLQLIKENLWVIHGAPCKKLLPGCYRSFSQDNAWKIAVLVLLEWKQRAVLQRGKLIETKARAFRTSCENKGFAGDNSGGYCETF